jgi:hypothetical protein
VTKGGDQRLVRNCISQFRISGLRHPCGEVFLTPPSSSIRNSEMESDQWFTLLTIRRSRSLRDFAYRDFGILMMKKVSSLDPSISWYPILQKKLDQRSRSNLELTAENVSRFRISRIREVREPRSFDSPVSEMTIFRHVSYGPNGPDLVMISTLHRPSLCQSTVHNPW